MRNFSIKGIPCPHCGKVVDVNLVIEANMEVAKTPLDDWKAQLHEDDRELVEMAESNGILKAFTAAMARAKEPIPPPKNPAKTFLTFLRRMSKWNLDADPTVKWIIDAQFPGESIEVFATDSVAAIVSSGVLRMFAPEKDLKYPRVASNVSGKIKVSDITVTATRLGEWVKTRNGYVPREAGTFFSEINKRNPGAFATLGNY